MSALPNISVMTRCSIQTPAVPVFPPTAPVYDLTVTTANPTGSITFNPPAMQFQTVGIVFTLDGTNGLASFDEPVPVTQVTTPEPAYTLLFGLLLIVGGYSSGSNGKTDFKMGYAQPEMSVSRSADSGDG